MVRPVGEPHAPGAGLGDQRGGALAQHLARQRGHRVVVEHLSTVPPPPPSRTRPPSARAPGRRRRRPALASAGEEPGPAAAVRRRRGSLACPGRPGYTGVGSPGSRPDAPSSPWAPESEDRRCAPSSRNPPRPLRRPRAPVTPRPPARATAADPARRLARPRRARAAPVLLGHGRAAGGHLRRALAPDQGRRALDRRPLRSPRRLHQRLRLAGRQAELDQRDGADPARARRLRGLQRLHRADRARLHDRAAAPRPAVAAGHVGELRGDLPPFAYLPAALGIRLATALHQSPYTGLELARAFGAVVALVFLAGAGG